MRASDSRPDEGRLKTKIVLADQIIVSGANFGMGLLLARFLGPSDYGQFILAYNVILFIWGLQLALLISPMMVLGPAQPTSQENEYYRVLVLQQALFSLFATAALLTCAGLAIRAIPAWGLGLAWAFIPALIGFTCQDFSRRYLFVRNRTRAALRNDVVTHAAKLAILVGVAAHFTLTVAAAFWIIGLSSLAGIASAVDFRNTSGRYEMPNLRRLAHVTRQHLQFGKWLVAESIVFWFGNQLILYVAGSLVSLSAVGAITAAKNVVGGVNILFLTLENLVISRAVRAYADGGEAALKRYLRRIAMLGGAGILAVVIVAAAAAEFWLRLLYGSAYRGYGGIVLWWGAYFCISFLQRPFSVGLRVFENTRGVFLASLGGAIVALTISYPAIRVAGVDGAMFTLCLVQAASLTIMVAAFRETLRTSHRPRTP